MNVSKKVTNVTIKYALLSLLIPITAHAETNILSYKYNDNVVISIANVPCPHKEMAKEYPYGAIAKRIDGQFLFGCFKRENENDIKIQWAKGDFTVLPANLFLINPNGIQAKPIEPTL